MLPEGASRKDLVTERDFQDHALRYGQSWYRYARDVRRRICPNGCLYLVTGADKARSWGLTSFSMTSDMCMVSVNLGIADTSRWEYSGCAFRQSNDTCPPGNENQCVFLRGFMISVRGILDALLTGQEVLVEDSKGLSPESLSKANSSRNTAGVLGIILNRVKNKFFGSENVHAVVRTEDKSNGAGENGPENQYNVTVHPVPSPPQVCFQVACATMIYPQFSSLVIHQLL